MRRSAVPLVAQAGDLAGELGKVLVGPALVVLDDRHKPLAHADQAVVGGAAAHPGHARCLDDLVGVAGLGAGDMAAGGKPDRGVVRRVGLVPFGAQALSPVGGDGVLAMVDKDELGPLGEGVQPVGQAVLVGVARKPAEAVDVGFDLDLIAKKLDRESTRLNSSH